MRIVNKGTLRILFPENGYELVNKMTGSHSEKVYLGINDSVDNYIELMKDNYYSNINELKNELDDENILLMNTLDSLIVLLEPVIAAMPMTLSEEQNSSPIDFIVKFYNRMIERGLKNINEVPNSFKELVKNNKL